MGDSENEVEEAVELLSELIDTADEATLTSEDEDGNHVEVDVKTGEVNEVDNQ